jgi:aquaporin Z
MNAEVRKCVAEMIGTFSLVFAGTAAVAVDAGGTGAAVSHVGVALTFGLVVFAMIAALGDVSGAHINPAVTIGFYLARRFPGRAVGPYVLAQCAGAIAASAVVRLVFGAGNLGATVPAGTAWQSWVLEAILTAGLMFVILNVSTGAKEKGITAGLAIGGVVAMEALFAGPVSGASMNPARSLGPAVVAMNGHALWVYLTAPIVGAAAAVPLCRCVREGCCAGEARGAECC